MSSDKERNSIKHSEKPEAFDGKNFKRWQMKLRFYLTVLKVVDLITSEKPSLAQAADGFSNQADLDSWDSKDYMCRNYILNCLIPELYDIYYTCKTAKELWNSLEKKYSTEDAGSKKFVVGKLLEFKM